MHQDIIREIYSAYQEKGYVSEERVLDALMGRNLPLDEIDTVCEALLKMGVIIRDENFDANESVYDRSQTDFEKLFQKIIELDDSLIPYINEIREIQPPQHREWRNLMLSAKNGNAYSRVRIILMYMRAVVKIALWHYKKYGIPISEAIQDGNWGLTIAFEKFEIGRQDNFSQYASFWIRQLIMRRANPINPLIYYPAHYKDRLFVTLELANTHDCAVCDNYVVCPYLINEVVDKLPCTEEEASELLEHLTPMDSFERLLEENEQLFSDNGRFVIQMNDEHFGMELEIGIVEILKGLKPRERNVIIKRFGLFGNRACTLEEVGKEIDVTRERVRQIEQKALRWIKKTGAAKNLKVFL